MKGYHCRRLITGLLLFLMAGTVLAAEEQQDNSFSDGYQRHMYMGMGFALADMKEKVSGVGEASFDNILIGVHLGYQFHENFAVEARGYGNAEDDALAGISVSVDRHYALLAKGIIPLDESFRPYIIAGAGRTKFSVGGLANTENDFIYGIGFAVNNGNPVELEVEWMRIYDHNFSQVVSGTTYHGKDTVGTFHLNLIYHFPSPGH
ncbi:hypothetical protein VA7868_03665 [Vibrio aerogenes CECT 7868]|uniref:Outer membrane protein beta-barrel domain-containing protein n=1 Tax=Vibrio aerogenes CECT 7868 TaxID=1216006 RepID=A0A1M6AYB9_9VIBR|nr:outer membrane beta-barrel protein [Vibrio aerogenes]SHI41509.1 hypothetical protein VA7868_03665 [Vibrio aerogenes CECT 7868]